ncbi:MAG: alpha/beta hydrolase [Crocinitomicaceae bacterium]|nr:alpha/beta hydrolase [Crocinitomicaceae bacterium]
MKKLGIVLICFSFLGCNLVQWNKERLTKKYSRKGVEEKVLQTDNHSIRYFEGGEGDTVVLIHGFGADGQMTWNKTILDLAKDYHVIVPDLLWFGGSTSKMEPNLTSQVDAMLTLLDHRKVSNCSLVGISYGGFVSLGMIHAKKELFQKVCIVDSPGMTYDVSLLDTLCEQENVEEVQEIFVLSDYKDVQELFDVATYKSRKIPKGILKDTYEVYFSFNHEEQYQLLATLPEEKERLKDFTIGDLPSLVIWGEHDQVFPLSQGKKLADFIGAELKVVPKAGHAPNIENFKVFQEYLRNFLAD